MITPTDHDLRHLPINILFRRCQEETLRFQHRLPHDPRYGFELSRRASERNEAAWEYVYQQYGPLVTHWIENHPALIYSDEDVPYLVNCAFERLWRSLTPQTFAGFTELKQVLRYLERCAHSCLLDTNRRRRGRTEVSLELLQQYNLPTPPEATWDEPQHAAFWQILTRLVKNEKEKMVLIASFMLDLKPQQIQVQYGHCFPTVASVYRVKQNLLQRLRQIPQLQEFC